MNLCLADIMIQIGTMRSMYGDGRLSTPFGELPINGDNLKSDGKELRRDIIDELKEHTIPPIIIDIG